MRKLQLGRTLFEMLMLLIVMAIIAMGGVWGVEYAFNQYTTSQMEREVITQMSSLSMRRRNIRVKEDGQIISAVPLKYITSQKISADRKTIVLTAEDVPEAVCNALISSEAENGYEVRLKGESCEENNTIEFISESRLERNIQETTSLQCSGVAKEYACSGKDEYDDNGCRTREVLHCASNQDCTCVGGGCSCVCNSEPPNCADFDAETCACKRCNIGFKRSPLGYCSKCETATISDCLQMGENCTCAECKVGYTYSDGKCNKCGMKGCLAYSSGCVCSSCDLDAGYRLIEGRCVKCEDETSPQGLRYCVANQYDNACRCTSCQSGYKLLDGGCVPCDALPGCTSYNNACGCTACNENSYEGPINGNCCLKKEGCLSYNDDCSCETCGSTYTKVNGSCCKNMAGCTTYNNNCSCTACDSTHYGLLNGSCRQCPVIDYCLAYNNDCSCKTCTDHIANCGSYNGACECTSCYADASHNNVQLLLSQDREACCRPETEYPCNVYSSPTNSEGFCPCASCPTGYVLGSGSDAGKCIGCGVEHCDGYLSGCQCRVCHDGYVLNSDRSQCCSPITNCGSYNENCKCTSCTSGNLSTGGSFCCADVTGCNTYSDTDCNCIGCEGGRTLAQDSSNVGFCCPTEENCSTYERGTTDGTCVCTGCNTGYHLTTGKHCKDCNVEYCTLYNDDCTCETCSEGKVLNPSKTSCCAAQEGCIAYNDECLCTAVDETNYALSDDGYSCAKKAHCTHYSGNICQCIACSDGYRVSGAACVACPSIEGCTSYDADCKCRLCQNGKTPSEDGSVCCTDIGHCSTYNNSCLCTACESEYSNLGYLYRYPSLGQTRCCDMIGNCNSYNDDGCTCADCQNGYGPIGLSICNQCPNISECSSYDDYCYCEECNSGFELDSGRGLACCSPMDGCTAYNEDCTCRTCQSGYTLLLNGTCFKNCAPRYTMTTDYGGNLTCCPPIDGCDEYTGSYSYGGGAHGCGCLICKPGYRLVNGICISETCYNNGSYTPASNCFAYAADGCSCAECREGYIEDYGECDACENHACTYNNECCDGYFCSYESDQTGRCRPITEVPEIRTQTSGNAKYLFGAPSGIYYKTAYNWCDAKDYIQVTSAAIGCGSTNSGNVCPSPFNLTYGGYDYWLKAGNWSDISRNYYISETKRISARNDFTTRYQVMCYKGKIPNTSCSTIDGCVAYNGNCGCGKCEDDYTLANDRCCPTIETCTSYNNSCECTAFGPCPNGEYKINGTCTDACPSGYNGTTHQSTKYCCPADCQSYTFEGDRCVCASCQTGSSLSVDGICISNTGNSCKDSSNCRRGDICLDGTCVPRSNFQIITKKVGGLTFMRIINDSHTWSWYESKDFCEAYGYKMGSRYAFSCSSVNPGNSCATTTAKGLGADSNWRAKYYLEPKQGTVAYAITINDGNGGLVQDTSMDNNGIGPLCYTNGSCQTAGPLCQAYDMLTCHCSQCIDGYYLTEDLQCLEYPNCAATNPIPHCMEYDENCNCRVCDSNLYTISNGACVPSCLPADSAACTSNNDCCAGNFCAFDNATGGSEANKGIGICRSLDNYPADRLLTRVGSSKTDWIMTQGKMGSWWSAENYCLAKGYAIATITSLNCTTSGYCTDRGVAGWGKASTALRALQAGGWKGSKTNWLQNMSATNSYDVNISKSSSEISDETRNSSDFYGLCYGPAGSICAMNTANCSTYNANCTCVGCNSGWELSGSSCNACTTKTGCATYDPSCNCTSCQNGYTFYDGVCYPKCTSNTQCATGYFCTFPYASACDSGSDGVCAPLTAYSSATNNILLGNVVTAYTHTTTNNSSTYGALTWWSAKNWCERQGKTFVSLETLQCQSSSCSSSPVLEALHNQGTPWSGYTTSYHWVSDTTGSCTAYNVNYDNGTLSSSTMNNGYLALCQCPVITNCTHYADDCSCTACGTGYALSGGNCNTCDTNYTKVNDVCYPSCENNTQCASTEFCAFPNATPKSLQISDYTTACSKGDGACVPISAYPASSTIVTSNGQRWTRCTTNGYQNPYGDLTWWSAENWCKRQGNKQIASREDIGCGDVGNHDAEAWCTESGSYGTAPRAGTALREFTEHDGWWSSGASWLMGDDYSSCFAWHILPTGRIEYIPRPMRSAVLCVCPAVDLCASYSDTDCSCTGCVDGYHLEGDHCVLSCSATNEACTSNNDCCNDTDYCQMTSETAGTCKPLFAPYDNILVQPIGSSSKTDWIVGGSNNALNWWSAQNYCERKGYAAATTTSLGCSGGASSGYCNGAVFNAFTHHTWSNEPHKAFDVEPEPGPYAPDDSWVEKASETQGYRIRYNGAMGNTGIVDARNLTYTYAPLCWKNYTGSCAMNVTNCTTYNASTCACIKCGGTNLLVSGKCCAPVPNCKAGSSYYNDSCECTECADGYTKVNGKCYKTCENNSVCASTEFCAFPLATSGAEQGLGACVPTSTYSTASASTSDGRTWIRSTSKSNATYGNMNWWSADNWCQRQKAGTTLLQMPGIADLGCSEVSPTGYFCTANGASGSATSGTALRELQDAGFGTGMDDYSWLSDSYDDTTKTLVYFTNSHVSYNGKHNPYYALCSCPSVLNCALYNNSCICTKCIGDYIQLDYPVHHYVVTRGGSKECIRCSKYHCIEFDPERDCACLECDDGFILSEGKTCIFGGTGGRLSSNRACANNDDCKCGSEDIDCVEEFCHFADGMVPDLVSKTGECKLIGEYGVRRKVLPDNNKWARSLKAMSWWSARNFCTFLSDSGMNYRVVTRSDIGCNTVDVNGYCTDDGQEGVPAKSNTTLKWLQTKGTPWVHGSHWLNETVGGNQYSARFGTSGIESFAPESVDEDNWQGYALCLRVGTCPAKANCATLDHDTCRCAVCNPGFKMQNGSCVSSCSGGWTAYAADGGNICCPQHCESAHTITGGSIFTENNTITFDNMCACTACDVGYNLQPNGTCPACSVEGCVGDYDSECHCSACTTGYISDGAGGCTACSVDNCASSTSYDASCNCTQCAPGYKKVGNACDPCDEVPNCESSTTYDSSCGCTSCATGYTKVNGKCYKTCSDNSACASNEFCAFPNATTSELGDGACVPTSAYTAETKTAGSREWVRSSNTSSIYGGMTLGGANNWCQRKGNKHLATTTDLGCPSAGVGNSCSGSNFTALRSAGWTSGYGWIGDGDINNGSDPNRLDFSNGSLGNWDHDYHNDALCTCATLPGCTAYSNSDCSCTNCSTGYQLSGGACTTCSVEHCASGSNYDSNCNCTQCEQGYKVQNGSCVACSVPHCVNPTGYDSTCGCTLCETGWTAYNGQCYPSCDYNTDCATGYFCAFPMGTVTDADTCSQGAGICMAVSEFSPQSHYINGQRWEYSQTGMSWWSATSWCNRLSRSAVNWNLGCESDNSCANGTLWNEFQEGSGLSGLGVPVEFWRDVDYSLCQSYSISTPNGQGTLRNYNDSLKALCMCQPLEYCTAYDTSCRCSTCLPDENIEDYIKHYGLTYYDNEPIGCGVCAMGNCLQFVSNECACSTCADGFTISNGKCVVTGSGTSSNTVCDSNADCPSTEFCKYSSGSGNTGTGGRCTLIANAGVSKKTLSNGGKWARSLTVMNWWSAKNFCERQTDNGKMYTLASFSELGCNGYTCTDSNSVNGFPGKSGSTLYKLQMESPTWQKGSHWLNDLSGSNRRTIRLGTCLATDGDPRYESEQAWHGYALCKQSTCSPINGCENFDYSTCKCLSCSTSGASHMMEEGNCVAACSTGYTAYAADGGNVCCPSHCANSHTITGNHCACTGCDAGYKLQGETCVACDVPYCASSTSYDSSCGCTSCATGYTEVNGKCYQTCSNNSGCPSTEFCAFPNASSGGLGDGACVIRIEYDTGEAPKTAGGRKWIKSSNTSDVYGSMTWASAENWCQRFGNNIHLATVTDLGCPSAGIGSTCSGSNLTTLYNAGWSSGSGWIGGGNINNAPVLDFASRSLVTMNHYSPVSALCTCVEVTNCTTYSDDDCSCTACAAGYELNGGQCDPCSSVSYCASSTSYDASCGCTSCQTGYSVSSNGICCENIPQCLTYDSSCACTSCDNATLSNGRCVSQAGGSCSTNNDCATNNFCSWGHVTSCSGSDPGGSGFGTCAPLSTYGTGTGNDAKTINVRGANVKFVRSSSYTNSTYGVLTWWSADNWCKRQGMRLATLADLGCESVPSRQFCTAPNGGSGNNNSLAYEGSMLNTLQTTSPEWTMGDYHWLADSYLACEAYDVGFNSSYIGPNGRTRYGSYRYALCRKCDTSTCSLPTYNDGCRCTSCLSGRVLVNGVCACPEVANCSTYNSSCECTGCKNGYTLLGSGSSATCIETCSSNDDCTSTQYCAFENPTGTELNAGQGAGICQEVGNVSSVTLNNQTWKATNTTMSIWSAKNWCQRQGKALATRKEIDCLSTSPSPATVCTSSTLESLRGSNLSSDTHWLDEEYDGTSNVGVSFSYGHIDTFNRQTSRNKPLCTCPVIPNCVTYSSTNCDCIECYGVTLSNGRCLSPTGGECNSNEDCSSSDDFCVFMEPTGCEDDAKGPGVCQTAYYSSSQTLTINGRKWSMPYSSVSWTWWSADSWCKRQGKVLATREDLGCGEISDNEYCTTSVTSGGTARSGSALRALQDSGWTNSIPCWLGSMSGDNTCSAYGVNLSDSGFNSYARNSASSSAPQSALCVCPAIAHCVAYNDNCECIQCDNGYVSNGACAACGTQVSNCNGYNTSCQCTSCVEGYKVNGGACTSCSGVGTSCTDNTPCCTGTYCRKSNATSGTCQALPTTVSMLTKVGTTTTEWVRTSGTSNITWWAHENLCEAMGYSHATRASLNCGTLSYCTDSGSGGYGKAGTAFRALLAGGWSSSYWWLEGNTSDTSTAYRIYATTSQGGVDNTRAKTYSHYGLCYKSYTPGSGNCAMDVENCSSYDPETCACKGCNSGWKKAGSGTSTYCTACTAKTGCATYNPSCYCTSCNSGYILSGSGSSATCVLQ